MRYNRKPVPVENDRPFLLLPRKEIKLKIEELIARGESIINKEIRSFDDLEIAKGEYKQWRDYSREYLRQSFSTQEIAAEFSGGMAMSRLMIIEPRLDLELDQFRRDVKRCLERLKSIYGRIELYREQIESKEKEPEVVQPQSVKNQIINYGTITHPIIAQGLSDITQSIDTSPETLIQLVEELHKIILELNSKVPEEISSKLERDISILEVETKSKKPRIQICDVSIEGLKKAAKDIGEIGKPILELVARILPIILLVAK
jgi:hypothetical protein